MLRRFSLARVWSLVLIASVGMLSAGAEDFAFVQVSDVHVSPHVAGVNRADALRGSDCIAWICRTAIAPQTFDPLGITTPAPAFALATGDLTEYGVIDETFADFERAFAPLPYPLYVLAGNHDNTWVAMYDILRKRHGGENYSFDRFGCHFVCLCSASPQEPVPSLDAKTRAWLKQDLDAQAPDAPIFVALHHPPDSTEFAPAEYDTFIESLQDYNVVLVLYGHGHSVQHRNLDGIDGIMGGSTFGKNAGYAVISVTDGTLRAAYHYQHKPTKEGEPEGEPAWKVLVEKPLRRETVKRWMQIVTPRPHDSVRGEEMEVGLRLAPPHEGTDAATVTFRIDSREVKGELMSSLEMARYRVNVGPLTPGWHLLSVRAQAADAAPQVRTVAFMADADSQPLRWRQEFAAAIKAGPVVADDLLIVARTDGAVVALDRDGGGEHWVFKAGAEILGTPAWSGERVVFGSGDGRVYAVDARGQQVWTFDAGRPVYGAPLIDGDVVYVGDNGGRFHAIGLADGGKRWTYARAEYAIECQPCVWGDYVIFGAWDGYLYAVARADGKLAWKVPGPKSSEGKAARYYSPADCGPVAVGDTLFVCDRGYLLATYDREGKLGSSLSTEAAAIAADEGGRGVLGRLKNNRVCKLDATGKTVWEQEVAAGRFPVPPTCRGDRVYVCSNTGLLSALDAADGRTLHTYQVSPGFYVMAPVAVDADGCCYVAGMDGTVTAVHFER